MISSLLATLADARFMFVAMTAIAAAATVLTVALPYLETDKLRSRMRAVSTERETIRARERERMKEQQKKGSLRQAEAQSLVKTLVNNLNLRQWLGTTTSKTLLLMAGYRQQSAEMTFLIARLVSPIGMMLLSIFYVFSLWENDYSTPTRICLVLAATYFGIKLPEIMLKNQISKRQMSIGRAFPDALDLLLICVESGMSIEQSFRKVASEIGATSVPLAEELALTTAELSYLQDRRSAYDNLAMRTGLDAVKSVATAMVQAERYGTPVGQALRVLSQEMRDLRMIAAEKKAAALPPQLTVPMIVFFLPVLFVVIGMPAAIQIFNWN
jgi:tight adherence protein C